MAETNLGQVVGIWLEPTEPSHKNVLWIKTTNLLTSEKAGFIWNGIEWINIQGLGFTWRAEFDENTDYTKNDVVKFEDALYIKLSDVVSSGDSPDVSVDFDLFLPTATPVGIEGSVQVKDANGRLFGNSLLSFIAGLFSIYGSLFLKSESSNSGNALEIRNLANQNLQTYQNDGRRTRSISYNNQLGGSFIIDHNVTSITTPGSPIAGEFFGSYDQINLNSQAGGNLKFTAKKIVLNNTGVSSNSYGAALWVETLGTGNSCTAYFSNCLSVGKLPIYYNSPLNDLRGFIGMKATGASTGLDINYNAQFGGMHTIIRVQRSGGGTSLSNMLSEGDGMQISFYSDIGKVVGQPIFIRATDYLGVRVKSTTQESATTEMFFKTTKAGVSVEPLLLTGKDVKQGYADGKQGFYGKEPISKQSLPQNATPQEILEALKNLGLIDIIIP